jgi:hypothetical protein
MEKTGESYVRKCFLDRALLLNESHKEAFMNAARHKCLAVEDIAVRFQLFDMYCLLQEQEAARPTSPMYFTQAFFYSCFQLVGRQAMAQALFVLIKLRIKHINPTTARKLYKYIYNLCAGRDAEWPKMSRSGLTIVELVQSSSRRSWHRSNSYNIEDWQIIRK